MAFKKNMFNKKPRRIHRNIGGRKKGSLNLKKTTQPRRVMFSS